MGMSDILPDGGSVIEGAYSGHADMRLSGNGREFIFNKAGRTLVMGILNVTPDSFSDGGLFSSKERAVARALEMVGDGADIIDIGGESTRPGAKPVSSEDELIRVITVVSELAKKGVAISIDTTKAVVAKRALDVGAWMINDVSAMRDPAMSGVLNEFKAPVVLMHMRGTPQNMQDNVDYDDITTEISAYLLEKIRLAESGGLDRDQIVIDPGLGFGKSTEGNFTIIRNLKKFKALGRPVLVGASRKSFLGSLNQGSSGSGALDRLTPTIAAHTAAILNGADMIRVHDVKEAVSAARICEMIRGTV
jgi:dihydropteroate synthase